MKKIIYLFFILNFTVLFAQKEVSGVVTDGSGAALPGVNIIEKGTKNAVSTDFNGAYKIKATEGSTLIFSYIGFKTVEKKVTSSSINVALSEDGGQTLDEIVVTGTRTAPRSNTTTPLPIDVLSAKDLASTGQATFDKALQYKIPSFNTVQTPVNDATSLLDPYEIRNMGPSRTLILINGKRKNMSALLYTQTSPGRGETGADISAIPQDAIERVEILRDGASAQYGSDAIAGVMNIILKKNTNGGSATLRTGITGKGDGEMFGVSINNGSKVGENGFINYTVDFSKTALANRPGTVDAEGEFNTFVYVDPNKPANWTNGQTAASITADNVAGLASVKNYLAKYPDARNVNGSPETAVAKFELNGGNDLSENTKFYYNAAYVYKKVNSYANFRTPYWRSVGSMPYLASLYGNGTESSYEGYGPTFIGDLNDYNATLGFKNSKNGWNTDASVTFGGNKQTYNVTNSQNRTQDAADNFIYAANPNIYTGQTTFSPGGTAFNHIVGNIDISKAISDKVSIGFGSEFRTENFEIIAGDKQSYDGSGADSFQGNAPENSGKFNRYNVGFYGDVAVDFTKNFLVNGTFRNENYSDFGSANVWKLSSRIKTDDDKFTLRGSISTGFRAPSLHQIYTEKSQSTFGGGSIVVTGILNNVSTAARQYGIPKLTAEKSDNITVGFGFKPTKNFNITLDYYNITVKDRIVLGNLVAFDAKLNTDPKSNNYNTYEKANPKAFFINAIDTRTSGIDFVANYKNIIIGEGKLGINFSGNYTLENKLIGAVKNPTSIQNLGTTNAPILSGQTALTSGQNPVLGGQTVFNATQDALMFTSRPKYKFILGGDYEINKFVFSLNNTMFGPTKFRNADYSVGGLYTEFETKIVTDLGINFNATDKLTFSLNINNIFNVLPKFNIKADTAAAEAIVNDPAKLKAEYNAITFDGRYSNMSYDGFHFSQLGTMFNLSMNYKF